MIQVDKTQVLDKIFEHVVVPSGCAPEFPLDFLAPGHDHTNRARAINDRGDVFQYVEGDFVTVPLYTTNPGQLAADAFELLCNTAKYSGTTVEEPTHEIACDDGVIQCRQSDCFVLVERDGEYGLVILSTSHIGMKP